MLNFKPSDGVAIVIGTILGSVILGYFMPELMTEPLDVIMIAIGATIGNRLLHLITET